MKKIYSTLMWKLLDPIDKAHILLVAEDVKLGATIGVVLIRLPILLKILNQLKIAYSREKYGLVYYVIHISKDKKALRNFLRCSTFQSNGRFYGYTPCSIKAHIKGTTKIFFIELLKILKEGKKYPDEFNYIVPGQNPCSINCQKCRRLLKLWKKTLIENDRKAAEALKKINLRHFTIKNIEQILSKSLKFIQSIIVFSLLLLHIQPLYFL